jgi:hypothetical protein
MPTGAKANLRAFKRTTRELHAFCRLLVGLLPSLWDEAWRKCGYELG